MVAPTSKPTKATSSKEEVELQAGETPSGKEKSTFSPEKLEPPKEGDSSEKKKTSGEGFKPLPKTFALPAENSCVRCLWNLSSEESQDNFVTEFPNGFSDNMGVDDPRVQFLQDNLTSENQGVWHFLLEATAEPKQKEFTPKKFPELLTSSFRGEDNIFESTVDATSTVDQEKTLHLKQAFKENLDHFRAKTDSSWLEDSNQQTISNLNTARILGLTPEKIAERRTWGNDLVAEKLVSTHKPVQPVDLSRFENGKYKSANLPLKTLLTREISLLGMPKRLTKSMTALITIGKRAANGKGKPKEITSPEVRRVIQRTQAEHVLAHDTIERTLEILILLLSKEDPKISACVTQILRALNVSQQCFEIYKKVEDLPQNSLKEAAPSVTKWLVDREQEYPLVEVSLDLCTSVPGFQKSNMDWILTPKKRRNNSAPQRRRQKTGRGRGRRNNKDYRNLASSNSKENSDFQ